MSTYLEEQIEYYDKEYRAGRAFILIENKKSSEIPKK